MRIYIPTHRRMDLTTQPTFRALSPEWQEQTTFVVDEADAKRLEFLQSTSSSFKRASMMVVPPEIQTIAQKRAYILRQAKEATIVMMDDDLRFAERQYAGPDGVDGFKLVPATSESISRSLTELDDMLRDDYVHAGFSARQGNNRLESGWLQTRRMMYVLGYQPAIVREYCELGRIETREDFDYTLQLFRAGFNNVVSSEICVDQSYNARGGCSLQRTMEASNGDAVKLARLHPGLVKVVDKEYKTSIPRKEVIVQWKAALESGLRTNEEPALYDRT